MKKLKIDKRMFFLVAAVCVSSLTLISCTKSEQQRTGERSNDAVNDAFIGVKKVLRNAAEDINNAVYKQVRIIIPTKGDLCYV